MNATKASSASPDKPETPSNKDANGGEKAKLKLDRDQKPTPIKK